MAVMLLGGRDPGTSPLSQSPLHYWEFSNINMLWQDTARTSQITTNGQVVKGVTDQGSGLFHLSEATNGPSYNTSPAQTINGYPCIEFDGTNDNMSNGTGEYRWQNSTSGSFCIMAVLLMQTTAAEGGGYNPGRSLYWNGVYMIGSSTTTVNPNIQTHDSTSAAAAIARVSAAYDTWYISTHIGVGDGQASPNFNTTAKCGLNDTRDASLTTHDPGPANFADSASATYIGGPGAQFWDGYCAEIVVFKPQCTEAVRKGIERFWANKYGLTLPY